MKDLTGEIRDVVGYAVGKGMFDTDVNKIVDDAVIKLNALFEREIISILIGLRIELDNVDHHQVSEEIWRIEERIDQLNQQLSGDSNGK